MSRRWLVGGVACAFLSGALWFAGDMLTLGGLRPLETPAQRVLVVILAVAAWLAWELLRLRKAASENRQLLNGLIGGSLEADSAERAAEELRLLRKRFEDALVVLRKARFRTPDGERRSVSRLPWYMFIGAPGSGKTTALLNAGLRFPLGDPRGGAQALQGVGGTRNCDWWFTDEAVLVDTAGRYTTQDSDRQADAAAWLGFLDLLKRFRPREPLNGVIVTLSISDLVHWNEEELASYARHVRERIGELYARLAVRLPIYVVVTKADLLAGFSEFFSEFDAQARAQVWGTTFPSTEAARDAVARYGREFAELERRLYTLLPERLYETRDLQRRAAIYRFPQQFRVTGPLVGRFLQYSFAGEWTGQAPLLRGVYYTSGTQDGSPIDRVLGTLARSFNLERKVQPPVAGAGKSYFLKSLLHEVMFGEAGLAGFDAAAARRRRLVRLGAYAGLAAITVILGFAWTASYIANRSMIEAAQARTAEVRAELAKLPSIASGDEAKLVALLSRLAALRSDESRAGWLLRMGFYQGDKLGAQANRVYRNALRDALLVHLDLSLANALRTMPTQQTLDAYIALHDDKPDEAVLGSAASRLWRLPPEAQAALERHLRAALAEQPLALPRGRDDMLIRDARRRLGAGATKA